MDRYARLFLHYVHGLTRRYLKVHTFTFGTRLTNITRCLKNRDPDVAMAMADAQVHDWKGGTRIASSLAEFNHRWARRVLTGNAAVLFVSDGLDRDDTGELALSAAAQLRRMAHEVVWLNPLLRFDAFQPKAERRARAAAACRQVPAGAQPREPRRPRRRIAPAHRQPRITPSLTPWNSKANDSSPARSRPPGTPSTTPRC